jgi:transcriptional regulator with XRE-family HTH domain
LRAKKKLSQGALARLLGVDKGYISNMENRKKNPTLAVMERLANALRVSVGELLR